MMVRAQVEGSDKAPVAASAKTAGAAAMAMDFIKMATFGDKRRHFRTPDSYLRLASQETCQSPLPRAAAADAALPRI